MYRFYAFPDRERMRLSQVVVLHPYRRRGLARALLEGARALAQLAGAADLTVEDPTDDLQRIRDVADVAACRDIAAVREAAASAVAAACAPEAGERALEMPPAVGAAMQDKLRLCKPQQRRVWKALLFVAAREAKVDPDGHAASAFKTWLRRRLTPAASGDATRKLLVDRELQAGPDSPSTGVAAASASLSKDSSPTSSPLALCRRTSSRRLSPAAMMGGRSQGPRASSCAEQRT